MQVLLKKMFGSQNERDLKKLQSLVDQINQLETAYEALSDEQVQAKTTEFKAQLADGVSLDDLLPHAFATVREASKRTLGMRHFDVQLIGGIVLHQGMIAEMKTGEGKTLTSTLAVYLNALTGKGVHVVTVNDYLAKRDAAWMGEVYNFLGLSVGVIVHGLNDEERAAAYREDVTYGTNNEIGFDFLRDNMKYSTEDFVQRGFHYSIVDEVDSILIDEARTPLIISGPAERSTEKYYRINEVIPSLVKGEVVEDEDGNKSSTGDFTIDEKSKSAVLTDEGVSKVEKQLSIENLYDPQNLDILHHVNQALKAHALFRRDVDYVVKDDKVMIVDEFTGRLMPGRRWSDGLHQAVEAKENVRIENENQTLATITFQNLFRMYDKLSGMTGTADTEAAEFQKIYKLPVRVIPTNRPLGRKDDADVIYKTEREKFHEVIEDIKQCHEKGQPILVGTISIEKSEVLAKLLKQSGVPHHVLNAKQHKREAEIVAQAGRLGSVTISTNMAGRGTDIVLGGNAEFLARTQADPETDPAAYQEALETFTKQCKAEREKVLAAGGLYVLGTERHESRRIDNQLRGRSGRQGDPGLSRFYLSLEDDLLRIFGSERISRMMDRLGIEEYEPITHPWISKAIANAQKKVEGHNFDIRKNLLEYDDVMNQQRQTIYDMRRQLLLGKDFEGTVLDSIDAVVSSLVDKLLPDKIDRDSFDTSSLDERCMELFGWLPGYERFSDDAWTADGIGAYIYKHAVTTYKKKRDEYGEEVFNQVGKVIALSTLDSLWKDQLLAMDHLRDGIGLRGYGQKDPLMEYKREGLDLFQLMMGKFHEDLVSRLSHVQISSDSNLALETDDASQLTMGHGSMPGLAENPEAPEARAQTQGTVTRAGEKIGRNDPCHCGSGKKFKKCHGAG